MLSQLPHEAIVTSTVAPRHYGVVAFAIFDEVEDAGEAKTRDDSTGKWLVKKVRPTSFLTPARTLSCPHLTPRQLTVAPPRSR